MICSACGESSLERLCSLGSIPLCDDFRELAVDSLGLPTFRLAPNLCPRCHHIELQEKPDCSSVYSRYLYRSRHSVDLSSHFSFYADSVTRFFEGLTGCRPKSVLDVGCNDGLLLDHFHKKIPNAVLHGLDPSPAINDVSKKIITHNVFFTEDYITSKQFSNTFDNFRCFLTCFDMF